MTAVPDLLSPRLRLALVTGDAARALVEGRVAEAERLLRAALPAGYPDRRQREYLGRQLRRLQEAPERAAWTARLLVLRGTGVAVGRAGFHGPPELAGRAEIGYAVFEPDRGHGCATEACAALAAWAFEQGERSVYLSIAPDNAPSLAIARRLGFVGVGWRDDPEEGPELVFELRAAQAGGSSTQPPGPRV